MCVFQLRDYLHSAELACSSVLDEVDLAVGSFPNYSTYIVVLVERAVESLDELAGMQLDYIRRSEE